MNASLFFLPFSDQVSSALFFQYNTQLGPPYYVLVDTNFINFSIKSKLDLFQSMMDCLYAKCKFESFACQIPNFPTYFFWFCWSFCHVFRCTMHNWLCYGRVGKNGHKIQSGIKVCLSYYELLTEMLCCVQILLFIFRIARDERFQRLPCMHKGIYADDCLVNRVTQVMFNQGTTVIQDSPKLITFFCSISVILWQHAIEI